jgi:hypothetical protein
MEWILPGIIPLNVKHFISYTSSSFHMHSTSCFWLVAEEQTSHNHEGKNLGLRQVTEIAKLSFFPFFLLDNWVQKFQNVKVLCCAVSTFVPLLRVAYS